MRFAGSTEETRRLWATLQQCSPPRDTGARERLSLVDQSPAADVDGGRGQRAGPVRGGEGCSVADVLKRRGPSQHRLALDLVDDRLATLEIFGERLGYSPADQGDDTHAGLAELHCELAAQRLDCVEGDLRPSEVVVAKRPGAVDRA